jgi:O-antigen/teichoic acid export membrane protein
MQNKATHKQAFFFTIINYVGILIGIVSTLFIYPKDKELLGIFRYVESLAQIIFPILLLGASQALINFHPKFDLHHKKQLFNYSVFSIAFISSIVFGLIIIASFFPYFEGMKYVYFAFPVAIFLAFVELFKKQSTIIQKISVPTFLDNILPKIALPVIFILVLTGYFSIIESLWIYCFVYGLIFLLLFLYVFKHFQPKFNFDFKSLFELISKNDYYKFSLFAFAGSLGSVFAFRIDVIMIKNFFNMETLGTFSIGVTLASALAVPATGIFILYAPKIANYLEENNLKELNIKYKEVSKLLFFIGALLYSGIFLGISDLFSMLPTHESLLASVPVILILGLNVLINMGTGFNGEIITYSKYFRFNIFAILLLVLLNVSLNLIFLGYFKMGIESVAVASLISLVGFNLAKLLFIYKKFRLLPFDRSYLKLIIIVIISLAIASFLPKFDSVLLNLMFKIMVCFLLNLVIIYKMKLVYQYSFWIDKVLNINK